MLGVMKAPTNISAWRAFLKKTQTSLLIFWKGKHTLSQPGAISPFWLRPSEGRPAGGGRRTWFNFVAWHVGQCYFHELWNTIISLFSQAWQHWTRGEICSQKWPHWGRQTREKTFAWNAQLVVWPPFPACVSALTATKIEGRKNGGLKNYSLFFVFSSTPSFAPVCSPLTALLMWKSVSTYCILSAAKHKLVRDDSCYDDFLWTMTTRM